MANIKAQATGNWSSPSTWSGGVLPGAGDVAFANGFTIAIDQSITVVGISKAAGTGITAGGQFNVPNGGITITCTGGIDASTQNGVNASNILAFGHTTGTVTINANLTGGGASTRQAIAPIAAGGTIVVNGTVTGGTGTDSFAIGSGGVVVTMTINGNVTAGSVAQAINIAGAWNLTINGSLTAVGSVEAIKSSATYTLAVNGDVTATATAAAWTSSFAPKATVRAAVNPATYPAIGDVRLGTVYGPIGAQTGTLKVPSPSAVAAGIGTDNTVGTAALLLADVVAATGAQIAAVANFISGPVTVAPVADIEQDTDWPYSYTGRSNFGTLESDPGWEITRITLNVSPPLVEFATGVWDDRDSLTYTA